MRRTLLGALASVTVLAAGYGVYVRAVGPSVTTVAVARRGLVQKVVVSGRVMPLATVNLGALTAGVVASVEVVEGQTVTAGETLLRLDPAEPRASLAAARAQLAAASARLEQQQQIVGPVALEADRQADANLLAARIAYARALKLLASGSSTEAEVDEAKRAYDVASSTATATRAQAVGAAGPDRRLALANWSHAKASVASAEVRLEQTKLSAPADSTVLKRAVEPGDVVQPGRVLLLLARKGETWLSIGPDEKSLAGLRLGLAATAAADAFPDSPFRAEVAFIAPAVDPARGTIEVRLRVPSPPAFLRPEMTVSVDIEIGRRAAALVVPNAVLHDVGTSPWVTVVVDHRTARRDVTLGLRGLGVTEIAAGLAEGELVVAGTSPVAWGRRVRTGSATP
jgi:HlyD family secretion protein